MAVAKSDLSRPAPVPHGHARNERALVREALRGSEQALAELFRVTWPGAYRAAFLIVHDHSAAEDIAQEALVAAIRNLDRFDRRRPLRPWLHRIVVNRAIDWTRVRTLRAEVFDADADGEDDAGAARYSDPVLAALRELPPDQRAVVVLRHLLEYTPGEIARMLELPRGTVNSRLRRGLDVLKARLEGEPR
ncbi:MAG TPA: RNA polymerase sigma factor [Thermoleophilaceae bacterium]|nr:RNA polymerase sigma factor [Thermoleophilaceae bacterium]